MVQENNIALPLLGGLYGTKVLVGFLYGWLHLHYYGGVDTWFYFNSSRMIYEQLWLDPMRYLQLVFWPNNPIPPPHLKQIASDLFVWADEPRYLMLRFNALLHLISGGYYNVHVVIWNFFSTLGLLWIYDAFAQRFPHCRKWLIAGIFFTPSLLFWGSGLHKAAICFCCIGGLLWATKQVIHKNKTLIHTILWIISAFFLLLIRPHALLLAVPAAIAYYWTRGNEYKVLAKYLGTYIAGLTALAILSLLSMRFNFFAKLASVRHAFLYYHYGGSDLPMPPMEASLWGFLTDMPRALYNTLLRPHFLDIHNELAAVAAVETLLIFCLIIITALFHRKVLRENRSFLLACIFYALSYYIIIGLTVDNLGAIVRYRTVPLALLVPALLVMIRFKSKPFS